MPQAVNPTGGVKGVQPASKRQPPKAQMPKLKQPNPQTKPNPAKKAKTPPSTSKGQRVNIVA